MKRFLPIIFLLIISQAAQTQQVVTDSSQTLTQTLGEVTVRAFEQNRKRNNSTASVSIIQLNNSDRYNKSSLVNSFNSIAGVRMEERSPGSYRINIRGSSLRSPFGVRNIKVYWNDIPVTDPGGNTYFNQFAWNNFSSIEIFKGPASSLYGAGTGGLILLNNFDRWQPGLSADYVTGSYGLQNIFVAGRFGQDDNRNQLTYAHNESDGYRQQTKLRRDNFSWSSQLKVSDKQQLTASVLFSDMYYQTPGALTLAEFNTDPKAARPAGAGFPGAVAAQAAIFQKNIIAGFTNHYQISHAFKNTTSLYGAFAQIKNSAIRNYERRNEPQFGARTIFIFTPGQAAGSHSNTGLQLIGGAEFQQGYFNTQVSKNRNARPDTLQTNDDVNNSIYSLFAQADLSIGEQFFLTAGISLNKTKLGITRLNNYPVLKQSRTYRNEMAPRIALLKKMNEELSILLSFSKGFSPPTTAEVLPSTGTISTDLEAERGWNHEATLRYSLFKSRLQLELTGFYFKLKNALVQRRDLSGADYFVNAGQVKQQGMEFHAGYNYSPVANRFIDYILLQGDYTYSHFRYGTFIKGVDTFSKKTVPSVPTNTLSLLADMQLKNGGYINLTYYGASKIFLNDANTAFAKSYQLLGARLGWKKNIRQKYRLNFYAGVDNLLDEKYSLGNDINAAANRFYNAAPPRNYYAGISLQWISAVKK